MGEDERENRLLNRRNVVAALAVVMLVALLMWQSHRERLVRSCIELGGVWDGAASRCDFRPGRILMRPGLQRG